MSTPSPHSASSGSPSSSMAAAILTSAWNLSCNPLSKTSHSSPRTASMERTRSTTAGSCSSTVVRSSSNHGPDRALVCILTNISVMAFNAALTNPVSASFTAIKVMRMRKICSVSCSRRRMVENSSANPTPCCDAASLGNVPSRRPASNSSFSHIRATRAHAAFLPASSSVCSSSRGAITISSYAGSMARKRCKYNARTLCHIPSPRVAPARSCNSESVGGCIDKGSTYCTGQPSISKPAAGLLGTMCGPL
mmetsp:Transcript_20928/g.60403  ORF Transcript_20928/g.60403 Transcript_20928/m.60403 type:complete len:251 (-) Transcript_20928:281-1033(-)